MKKRPYPLPCYGELVAIATVGILHVVTELLVSPGAATAYNATVALLFAGYLAWRALTAGDIWARWGFTRAVLGPAFRTNLAFCLPAGLLLLAYGLAAGTWPLPASFWLTLVLYPVWGIAQQFAVQNMIGNNLKSIVRPAIPHAVITAACFSAPHYPNLRLMALTLGAGFVFTLIYRRHPNLWALGTCHGVLGALAYYLVLGEDPGRVIMGAFSQAMP